MKKKEWTPLGKRHNWTQRNGGDITYKLLVFDGERKLDKFVFNTGKRFREILELIRLKYGINYK